jgi:hypothetical protein
LLLVDRTETEVGTDTRGPRLREMNGVAAD